MTKFAYLIDSAAREIRQVEWTNNDDLRRFVGGFIETAAVLRNGDTIYVDEEGLLKSNDHFFAVWSLRQDQAFAGNGVIVGREEEGEGPEFAPDGYITHNPLTDIHEFRRLVTFQRRAEIMLHFLPKVRT